jgi:hypothetical protein
MTLSRSLRLLIITALLGLTQGARAEALGAVGSGAWDSRVPQARPLLFWEELKGYRLFFHPDDAEPLRRMLTLAVPADHVLTDAWAIIRPLTPQGDQADAWLRVEGEPGDGNVSIQWDGTYRGQPFPDGPYLFEIHIRWKPDEERSWKVIVLKSKDYPLFYKIGGGEVGRHPLIFNHGQFEPVGVTATFSRSAASSVSVLARVLAPSLDGAFATAGIEVQGRLIEDPLGKPVHGDWQCLCQQPLPADSPARKEAKKVRCDWDLSDAPLGTWDLRLGLYHQMNNRLDEPACDSPILDEDRIRVVVAP